MMKKNQSTWHFIILILAFSFSIPSSASTTGKSVKISVSRHYPNYRHWLLQSDSTLVITDMNTSGVECPLKMPASRHALLAICSEHYFPDWYGMIHDKARCSEYDCWSHTLEIKFIRRALKLNPPLPGICRRHQRLNVTPGGSLTIDFPDDIKLRMIHPGLDDPLACRHQLRVLQGSNLHEITGQSQGIVNTNHHEPADVLTPGLRISMLASGWLAEAIELEEPETRAFLPGVQWQTERMEQYPESSRPVDERFIREFSIYSKAATIRNS